MSVNAIELPGREARFGEKPYTNLGELLDVLADVVAQAVPAERDFMFFGHSMGATIAFELVRRMHAKALPLPRKLMLSGRKAPQTPERFSFMHDLSENDFIDGLRAYGGTPEAVLQNEELMELFVPLLRADFTLFETWPYKPAPPLGIPMTLFGGSEDPRALRPELQAWRIHTSADFRLRVLPGGHFFLRDNEELMLGALAEELITD